MKRLAPTWYLAGGAAGLASIRPIVRCAAIQAASQERHEARAGQLPQELSRPRPIVLFLDDLHWADSSSMDMIGYLGEQFDDLRLLIIVTYRPSELMLHRHPLLAAEAGAAGRGFCSEIAMPMLSREEIQQHLALEFPAHEFPPTFPDLSTPRPRAARCSLWTCCGSCATAQAIVESEGAWRLAETLSGIER